MIQDAADRKPLPAAAPEPPPAPKLLRLDLGCGQRPKEGFEGVDIADVKEVTHRADLFTFPWPFEDESVDEVHCSHFFEHVPAALRFPFMDELYRIMKPGSRAAIICPYYNGARASQDPTHEWPPISEASFLYFDKRWREANQLDHYHVTCDFEAVYAYSWYPDWAVRNEEARAFAAKHYTNVIMDIHVSLVKRVMDKDPAKA
jgi:SAM-dependent methyltransferase